MQKKISVKKKEYPSSEKYYDIIATHLTEALYSTAHLLDEKKLDKAIQLISQAKNLYIFGVGSSGNTSLDLESMFLRVGVQAKAVLDPHFQAQVASLMEEDDVIIAFSLSGKTKDTFDSVEIAKKKWCKDLSNYQLPSFSNRTDSRCCFTNSNRRIFKWWFFGRENLSIVPL